MKIGSLFSGAGGLDLGVQAVLGGEVAWHCENDKAASRVLAHHWPGVPNLGDITTVDWARVEPVDVLTGGFPCQDVSTAGKRGGLRPDTRSGLWTHMAYAIDQLRPSLVIIENVRGLLSATADSDVEFCPWCMGETGLREPDLRALGAVLGDLADLLYDAEGVGLRAADVGACHGRFRVLLVAYPQGQRHEWGRPARGRWARPTDGALLPTPRATDGTKGGSGQRGSSGDLMLPSAAMLLPTSSAADGGGGHLTRGGDRSGELLLPGVARDIALLPTPTATPTAMDSRASGGDPDSSDITLTDATVRGRREWGVYADAIARWEALTTRPAPSPTQLSEKYQRMLARRLAWSRRKPGTKRPKRLKPAGMRGSLTPVHVLSPRFVEWMMGLPEGHISGVPDVTRSQALTILGNGVVPAQCAAAIAHLLDRIEAAA